MPKWAIDAIAAIAGIAAGGGLVMSLGPLGPADACSDELTTVREQHAALTAEVEQVATRADAIEGRLASVEGKTMDWPDDVAEIETEAQYLPLLGEAIDTVDGAERVRIDCAEYPCVAVVRFAPGADGAEAFSKLQDAMNERGFEGYQVLSGGTKAKTVMARCSPFGKGSARPPW